MKILIIITVIVASGCASITGVLPRDEIASFRQRYPNVSSHYKVLRETNIDRYFDLVRVEAASHQLIMRRLKEKFPEHKQIVGFADNVYDGESARMHDLKREISELKEAAKDGGLYEFEYENDDEIEWGFLVIKDGKIVLKKVWSNAAAGDGKTR